jgi:tungstate transport system ATP-binding protein
VSLARAFAVSPEIIFLDEPFSALDAPTREELAGDLHRSLRATGITAVFVTHDRNEALSLADRVAVMREGKIVQTGTPEEVATRPVDEFVAAFMGMDTIVGGVVEKSGGGMTTVSADFHLIELCGDAEPGTKALIGIRPENVTLSLPDGGARSSARNVFRARIASLSYSGPLCKARLDCGFRLTALVTANSALEMGLSEGMEVDASVKATAVYLIKAEHHDR